MQYQLTATPITAHSKGEMRRLRAQGFVPVSIQHRGAPTLHLMEELKPLQEFIALHGQSALIDLVVEPGSHKHKVMVHDVQRDPLTQLLIQVTFQKIQRTDKIHTQVPIVFTGVPESVMRKQATGQHSIEQVEIQCSQQYLPEYFTVDVSGLEFGSVIRVADIPHDKHVTMVTPADTVVMSLKGFAAKVVEDEPVDAAVKSPTTPAE